MEQRFDNTAGHVSHGHRQVSRGRGASPGRSLSEQRDIHAAVDQHLAFLDHRYTKGRRRLVEVLARAGRPLTLPEISSHSSDLPQSSAYRNLDVLERAGVIRRITHTADHAYFELAEPFLDHHHHLVCIECGQLADIHLSSEVERLVDEGLTQAARDAGFTPLHHSLDLHGYCADCLGETSPGSD